MKYAFAAVVVTAIGFNLIIKELNEEWKKANKTEYASCMKRELPLYAKVIEAQAVCEPETYGNIKTYCVDDACETLTDWTKIKIRKY